MGQVDATRLKQATGSWARQVITTASAGMPDQMRGYAPIGKPTQRNDGYEPGKLRESIQVDPLAAVLAAFDSFTVRLVAPVIQARTTDQGSPAHIIRPRRVGGVLIFEVGGQTVGARFVNHPGNVAKPWWNRALEATWGPNLRYAALHTQFG